MWFGVCLVKVLIMSNKFRVKIVIPTKLQQVEYLDTEAGDTLIKLLRNFTHFSLIIEEENSRGLVALMEEHLNDPESDYVLFVHDDVLLRDILTFQTLEKSFEKFDIIGLAGSSFQYYGSGPQTRWDTGSTSRYDWGGFVAHTQKDGTITSNYFGQTPKQVVVIDGLFMGFNSKKFRELGIKLDTQFEFHHYDLDTCITCHKAGMSIGVIPMFVIHESIGELDGNWEESAKRFLKKHYNKTYKV